MCPMFIYVLFACRESRQAVEQGKVRNGYKVGQGAGWVEG